MGRVVFGTRNGIKKHILVWVSDLGKGVMQIAPCSLGPHSYGSDTNCFNVVLDNVDNRAMKIGMVANEGRGEIDASFEVFRASWRTWNGSAAARDYHGCTAV
jgi:hypothetical protein